MSARNLPMLTPKPIVTPEVSRWATVTQVNPLRIKIDNETTALPFTPDTLVQGLVVNDRVWVAFPTNDNPTFRGRRVIVLGMSDGPRMASGLINITPVASTPTSGPVTFPAGRFTVAPNVVAIAQSAFPETQLKQVTLQNITTSGCDIYLYRLNTTLTAIHWIAIQP